MRLGIVADMHLGYRRGHKTLPDGANIRENDIYISARLAIKNLLDADVDAIVDLGDIAHSPHPPKRAILELIHLINDSNIDWYSANGNHTLQRSSADTHLYDLLEDQCPRFYGYWRHPAMVEEVGAYLIPYDTAAGVLRALDRVPTDAALVVGHWACEDADWPGDHIPLDALPQNIPVLLGHWHTRNYSLAEVPLGSVRSPVYIGATDRLSWGEANNPTGVAIFDTDINKLSFIDHETRPWIDIKATPENYLWEEHYEDIEDAIVRVSILATPEQYHALDMVRLRKQLAPSLEHQILRVGTESDRVGIEEYTSNLSLRDNWQEHVGKAKLPKTVDREEVERLGIEALE